LVAIAQSDLTEARASVQPKIIPHELHGCFDAVNTDLSWFLAANERPIQEAKRSRKA
jgi:hypothetical protein